MNIKQNIKIEKETVTDNISLQKIEYDQTKIKTHKKKHFYGIDVYFPYEPYPIQNNYMSTLIKGLKENKNSLLESPTGTGKTLCLLCASLAWLKNEYDVHKNYDKKIIFTSRTISQIQQVVSELKKTVYITKSLILSSRDNYCIYKGINSNFNGEELNFACGNLQSIEKTNKFPFYFPQNKNINTGNEKIFDIEDLCKLGNELNFCPYYYAKRNMNQMSLLFMPYVYLLDRFIFKKMDINVNQAIIIFDEAHNIEKQAEEKYSNHISVKNIDKMIKDINKNKIEIEYEKCENENEFKNNKIKNEIGTQIESENEFKNKMKIENEFENSIECVKNTNVNEENNDINNNMVLENQIKSNIKIEIENKNINYERNNENEKNETIENEKNNNALLEILEIIYKLKNKKEIIEDEVINVILKYLNKLKEIIITNWEIMNSEFEENIKNNKNHENFNVKKEENNIFYDKEGQDLFPIVVEKLFEDNEFSEFLNLLEEYKNKFPKVSLNKLHNFFNVVSFLYSRNNKCKQQSIPWEKNEINFYKLAFERTISKNGDKEYMLSLICFSPHFAFKKLINKNAINFILTSGTLSPLDTFESELQIKFEEKLTNPHVVDKKNIFACISKSGQNGTCFNFNFNNRNCTYLIQEIGNSIIDLCNRIPHGILIFFPSYMMLNNYIKIWKENNILYKISEIKYIEYETKNKDRFKKALKDYQDKANSSKGAIFFGILNGKVSEGIDFSDDLARSVFIIGIPYPPIKDKMIVLREKFLKELKIKNVISFKSWFNTQGIRASNQAIGRIIRNKSDWGSIFLFDERYEKLSKKLSTWIQKYLIKSDNFQYICNKLNEFHNNKNIFTLDSSENSKNNKVSNENQKFKNLKKTIKKKSNNSTINYIEKKKKNDNKKIQNCDNNINEKLENMIDESYNNIKNEFENKNNNQNINVIIEEKFLCDHISCKNIKYKINGIVQCIKKI